MTATTKISYAQALAEAIRMEMHRDPDVVCVAIGSAARRSPVTGNLATAFGAERIVELDSHARPVSIAAGMAARGLRVVCEVRAEHLGPDGLAPLAELDAGAEGSVVVRVPDGGPEVGERPMVPIESRLLDTPNLTLLAPTTPADAKGMLVDSIRSQGSTALLEAEPLYASVGDVPEGALRIGPASATVGRNGEPPRVTMIAYGLGAQLAREALGLIDAAVELLDLRSLRPLDRGTLVAAAARTGKVAVVEPAGSTRVGAEVAAALMTDAFEYLDGPLERIELDPRAGLDEGWLVESAATIAGRVDELASY